MKNLLKTILILSPLVFLAVVGTLYLNLNRMVKGGVENVGPLALKAPVTLERAALSLLNGHGTLEGLVVGNPEGFKTPHAFQLGRINVDVDVKSLRSSEVLVRRINIEAPEITVEGLDAGNLKALQQNAARFGGATGEAAEEKPSEPPTGKKVVVELLTITGAKLNYSPSILQGKSIPIPLPDIEMKDLGKASGGLTLADLLVQILGQIDNAVIGALKGSTELIGKATGEIVGGAVAVTGEGLQLLGDTAAGGADAAKAGAEALEQGADALRVGVRKINPFGSKDPEPAPEGN